MDRIAVVGGGIAGCSAAYRLYEAGMQVVLIEKSGALGGNIRNFGCKADEKCVRDNLCLVEGVFGKVRAAAATGAASGKAEGGIEIIYDSEVVGLSGKPGDYELQVSRYSRPRRQSITLSGISSIIIATGHIKFSEIETGSFEWTKDDRVIWASRLEELLYERGPGTISKNTVGKDTFEKHTPDKNIPDRDSLKKAVFIQCVGSRSVSDCADYCSRVCCGYSYRMARALKYFYKDIQIDMLYMDLQEAGYVQELSFEELDSRGIGHILCRPVSVKRQDSEQYIQGREGRLEVICEDREKGGLISLQADLVVLSEGIHPGAGNESLAGIFNLQADDKGFLGSIEDEDAAGIYLAGTIKGPRAVSESINDARRAAAAIINKAREAETDE